MEEEKKYIYIMVLSREIKQEWTILELITWKSRVGHGHGEVPISILRPIGRSMERAKPRRNEEEERLMEEASRGCGCWLT